MNGQIIITVTDNAKGTDVNVDMRMYDVSMVDKMRLLHSMVRSFEMDSPELETFIIEELAGVFDGGDTVRIDRGAIEEVLKDHP